MALGSIVVDLLLRTGAFNNDAKLAERRLKDLSRTAKAAGAAIGIAFAGAVTVAATSIKSAIDRMDEMSKAAQRAMMPTEQFSQLAYAGSLADVAMNDLMGSMGKLARTQAAALEGGKAQAQAFRTLGIEIANADGTMRSTRDVFMDFADVFQENKSSPEVMALGMQLFGRSFQNLIPLMKDGSAGLKSAADEADRLGITLDTKAGQQAEAFNDNITRLKTQIDALWQGIAIDLMPELLRFSERLNSAEFRDGFSNIFNGAVSATRALVQFAATTANVVNWIGEELAARLHGAAADDIVRLEDERDRILKQLRTARSLGGTLGDMTDAAREALGLPTTDQLRKRLGELYTLIDGYQPPRKLEAPAAAQLDAGSGGITLFNDGAAKAAAKGAADALRELERAQEEAARRAMEFTAAQDDARKMLEDMRAEAEGPAAVALLKYARLEQELGLLMAENVLTFEQYAEAMQLVHDARAKDIASLEGQGQKVADDMAIFAEQAQRNMQSWLGDSLYQGLSGSFDGIADAFSDMLKRMVAEMMASQILQFFMGNSATGQGGIFDLFGSGGWGGYAGGGYTGPGGRNAPAGVVHKGEVVWSQHDIARAGGVGVVESMRRGLRGYASGGVVGGGRAVSAPSTNVKVEVINNSGAEVSRESGRTPDGQILERIIIGTVQKGFGGGDFDGAMQMFGARRQGAR